MKKHFVFIPILLILICIIFYPVLFQGKIFSSPDSLNPIAASIILDKTQKEIGEYPLWQPWIFSGMPTAESFTNTSNLYFLQYFFNLLRMPAILIHLLHFFLAGVGMYIVLRYLKLSQIIAIIGASGFMLMPYLITMEVFGHGSQAMTAAYIPWVFWATLKLFDNQRLIDVGVLAILLGLQLQRAHVQIAYYTWMFVGVLFLFKLFVVFKNQELRKTIPQTALLFAIALLLSIGIAALVYLPSLQYSAESIRSTGQPGSASYDYATSWSFHPKEMLTFLIPSAYGFGGETYWGRMPFTDYPNYMGILFLLLAILAIVKNRTNITWFLAGTTLLALLISFGRHFSVIYNLFYDFAPFFSKFRVPSMILIIVQFNTIILACFGLALLSEIKWKNIPKWFWWLIGIIIFCVLILLFGSSWLEQIVANGFTQPRVQDQRLVEVIYNLRWKMWYQDVWVMLLFIIGLIGPVLLLIKEKINKTIFIIIIGVLSLLDLMIVDQKIVQPKAKSGRSSQLVSKRAIKRYFNHDKVTTFLTQDTTDFRVYPLGPLFGESRLQAFGIESVGGYHPAKLTVYNNFLNNTNNISTLPLMRMLNVKYVLSPQVINHPELNQVFADKMPTGSGNIPIWVYELSNSLPRAWLVKSVENINEQEMWKNLLSDSFDPLATAYMEKPINDINGGNGTISDFQSSIHRISLKISSNIEEFLVLSEVFYPLRWKAKLNGVPIETIKTNGIVRGLLVPSGEHLVEFEYDRKSFSSGILVSIISSLIAISLIGIGLIRFTKQ